MDFSAAIQMRPGSATAYSNRGAAYMFKKDYDKAIADCNEAIRIVRATPRSILTAKRVPR